MDLLFFWDLIVVPPPGVNDPLNREVRRQLSNSTPDEVRHVVGVLSDQEIRELAKDLKFPDNRNYRLPIKNTSWEVNITLECRCSIGLVIDYLRVTAVSLG